MANPQSNWLLFGELLQGKEKSLGWTPFLASSMPCWWLFCHTALFIEKAREKICITSGVTQLAN
jgi:hypothetical protein